MPGRRILTAALVTGAVCVLNAGVATSSYAATASACSAPTRAVCVTSDAGSAGFSKDDDGDYTTATNNEVVVGFWAVENNTDQPQTVSATLVLDGPGTSEDKSLVVSWELAPQEIRQGTYELFKVHKKDTPKGTYTWTVAGSGTESVSATATFVVY